MQLSIDDYKTIIFDCDGVILNSNKIKTKAFYETALSYGKESADNLVKYHVQNGGISRYKKFEFFLKNIVGIDVTEDKLNSLLLGFSKKIKYELSRCEVAEGIFQLREKIDSNWIVVSGSDQDELNEIFSLRSLDSLFIQSCIFGSPESKEFIFEREFRLSTIKQPALFIGDSQYDHEVSSQYKVDFIFLSNWTEFANWKEYTNRNSISTYGSIKDLLLI
jgi:phosphoglycolate phosphatase-like HAD superfamily hydrolase